MHEDRREKLHRAVDDAARPEEERDKQQRNAGVAIAVLFLLVLRDQTTPYRRSPASPRPGTM